MINQTFMIFFLKFELVHENQPVLKQNSPVMDKQPLSQDLNIRLHIDQCPLHLLF